MRKGAYYAQQKNVIISMINVESATICQLGFQRILKSRQKFEETLLNLSLIWQFKIRKLNIKTEHCTFS